MKRLPLPRLFRPRAAQAAAAPAAWRRRLLGALLLAGAFCATFYLAFPDDALQQRLNSELSRRTGLAIGLEQASLGLPPKLRARRLIIEQPPGLAGPLTLERLQVAPCWLALLAGDPGLTFDARYGQGRIAGSWRRSGPAHLDIRELPLPELPLAQTGLHLSGTLMQGLFSGRLDGSAAKAQPIRLALTGQGLRITGLDRFGLSGDQLPLGTLQLTAQGRGGRLELEKLTLRGGDLQLDGRGSLLLAPVLANSRLNLTLTLRPGEHFDATLRQLLTALARPAPDGTLRLHLSGSAGRPQLRPASPAGG